MFGGRKICIKNFRGRSGKGRKDWMVHGKMRNLKPPQKFAQDMNRSDYTVTFSAPNDAAFPTAALLTILVGCDVMSTDK